MRHSISLKITLVLVLISLIGAVIAGFYVENRVRKAFESFVRGQDQSLLVEALIEHYSFQHSWEGVDKVFINTRLFSNRSGGPQGGRNVNPGRGPIPFVVTDPSGLVMAGGGNAQNIFPGSQLPKSQYQNGIELTLDGEIIGWLVSVAASSPRSGPDQDFIETVRKGLLVSALITLTIALILGGFLIRSFTRPIRQLVKGTDQVAEGELGYSVDVKTDDELGRLARSFNRMSADLQHADQARRRMTADIAHDLRTPLSVISGYTEALQEGKLSGNPEIYRVMHQQAAQLNALIEDLRTLSLLDAGEFSFNPRMVRVETILDRTTAAFKEPAQAKQISLALKVDPDLSEINLDPVRLIQVLENLVSNAIQVLPEGGRILLSAEQTAKQIVIEVTDNGPGLPPEDLPHIFDRFYRVDKSRTPSGGSSGLGLAIARKLVEAQGGKIGVHSTPGEGTTFRITFPLRNEY